MRARYPKFGGALTTIEMVTTSAECEIPSFFFTQLPLLRIAEFELCRWDDIVWNVDDWIKSPTVSAGQSLEALSSTMKDGHSARIIPIKGNFKGFCRLQHHELSTDLFYNDKSSYPANENTSVLDIPRLVDNLPVSLLSCRLLTSTGAEGFDVIRGLFKDFVVSHSLNLRLSIPPLRDVTVICGFKCSRHEGYMPTTSLEFQKSWGHDILRYVETDGCAKPSFVNPWRKRFPGVARD